MTYSISISGHKDTGSEQESREFEEAALAEARHFVQHNLQGVTSASFSGGHIGGVDLTQPDTAEGAS